MQYKTLKRLNLPELDKEILSFWEENKVFEKSVNQREEDNRWVFYEGPPSANGMPGIHHVIARAVKDLFCRYQTMKGKRVERKGGWDTHGLPVELKVEKENNITKDAIGDGPEHKMTIAEYNAKCRETVMKFKDEWDEITVKMGYWVDLDDPYITFENNYIETVWYLLKKLYDKGLIYKGYTIQPYSPAAGTGLSSHELNLPGCYREVKDTTVVGMFIVNKNEKSAFLFDEDDEDVRLLAWTTTPWTLLSNTALTVGPKIDYVKIKTINPYTDVPVSVVLAAGLKDKWFSGKNQPEVLSESEPFKGAVLEDVRFEQLFDFGNPIEPVNDATDAFRVITGDFVTLEDGTGIVHTAPSFGADDYKVAYQNGIGALTLVTKQGKFVSNAGPYSDRYVKNYKDDPDYVEVDVDIAVDLKKSGKAFNIAKYLHNYPHCWRTDKPILYYPLDSWFIKASAVKERMSELNETINWKPKSTGTGRFGVWLDNLMDWNLSRSRFWGVPLPIWRTKDSSEEICIGSEEQLSTEIEKANLALGLDQKPLEDFHRPYVDDIVLVSDKGEPMHRELDLIDVWFDSGSMPYAQWHYPFENKEKFEENFPADFIAEGVDQTRGWFYTLHAIATMCFDSVAYKNVVSNGLVLDKDGQKMSKTKGNTVDPFETIDQHGADAVRWYMIANANPWDNLKFDEAGITETVRKFFGTLYNTYSFFALYANVDGFTNNEDIIPIKDRPELDKWIISLLNSLVKETDQHFADFESTKAARKIQLFVGDHLSNWYVRLGRRRFWKGDFSGDKIAAYQTLHECLLTISKMMSPIAPFFGDWLFKSLTDPSADKTQPISVHLTDYPQTNVDYIDEDLETRMSYAQRISSLILSIRKKEQIRVRQPLTKAMVPVSSNNTKQQVNAVSQLILHEVNIQELELIEDSGELIKKSIKPNFKTLGRRLGKNMKAGAQAIAALTIEDIRSIEQTGKFDLKIGDEIYSLVKEDFVIASKDIPGWHVASDGEITVALDITLTDELVAEGLARELVNRIQNLRKSSDFDVTDRINIFLSDHNDLTQAKELFGDYIQKETLANAILPSKGAGEMFELPGGIEVEIEVEKV
jgi:isoleucyl-tRNA synthetase